MPRVERTHRAEFEHTFAWSLTLEPQQKIELFGEGTPIPPGGVQWDHKASPPYLRTHPGVIAVLTALGCSDPTARITLSVGYKPRTFSGPWLTDAKFNKLDPPIAIGYSDTLTGSVQSFARTTELVHVWLRTRVM